MPKTNSIIMNNYKLLLVTVSFCLFATAGVRAQSLMDILKNASQKTETPTANNNADVVGTWEYRGSVIQFKSEDLLKKAGGAVVAAARKKQLDEQLLKYGIKPGAVSFVLKSDASFSGVMNNQSFKGVYSYDAAKKQMSFTIAGFFVIVAQVTYSKSEMKLLFDGDKLMVLFAYFGEQIKDPGLRALAQMASAYDGLMMGMELKRK